MNAKDQASILSFAKEVAAAMGRLSRASDKYEAKVDALEKRVAEMSVQIVELKGIASALTTAANRGNSGDAKYIYEFTTTADT